MTHSTPKRGTVAQERMPLAPGEPHVGKQSCSFEKQQQQNNFLSATQFFSALNIFFAGMFVGYFFFVVLGGLLFLLRYVRLSRP